MGDGIPDLARAVSRSLLHAALTLSESLCCILGVPRPFLMHNKQRTGHPSLSCSHCTDQSSCFCCLFFKEVGLMVLG